MLWPFIDCYWCISIEKLPLIDIDFSFVNHKSPSALWGVWGISSFGTDAHIFCNKDLSTKQSFHVFPAKCCAVLMINWKSSPSGCPQSRGGVGGGGGGGEGILSSKVTIGLTVFQNRNGQKENPAPDRDTDFWTLFQTQRGKNHTLLSGTSPYCPYMRVKKPPPPKPPPSGPQ